MGPVAEVTAHAATLAHERIAVEDTVVATLKFKSGALGVIEATTAAYPGYLKRIEIHGATGSALMEEEDIIKWDFAKEQKRDAAIRAAAAASKSGGGGASDPSAIGHHGHALQFADVLSAIKRGKSPLVDGPQGRQAVETILAIYKAAETGKVVKLPLKGDPTLKARRKPGKPA
jgi:predicted dehydrogenase